MQDVKRYTPIDLVMVGLKPNMPVVSADDYDNLKAEYDKLLASNFALSSRNRMLSGDRR